MARQHRDLIITLKAAESDRRHRSTPPINSKRCHRSPAGESGQLMQIFKPGGDVMTDDRTVDDFDTDILNAASALFVTIAAYLKAEKPGDLPRR